MYALNLKKDGRVLSVTYPEYAPADAVLVDALPEGDVSDYLYVSGKFIYDPVPHPEPDPTEERTEVWDELDAAYQEGVNSAYDK